MRPEANIDFGNFAFAEIRPSPFKGETHTRFPSENAPDHRNVARFLIIDFDQPASLAWLKTHPPLRTRTEPKFRAALPPLIHLFGKQAKGFVRRHGQRDLDADTRTHFLLPFFLADPPSACTLKAASCNVLLGATSSSHDRRSA